ncbi:MAG: four helix bundle protein [Patescibacteria group bacterium]
MARVNNHKELLIWQRSMDLAEKVYKTTNKFPNSEQWGLTSQMRRAVVSIPSNIAEGFGRQATGEYRHHLAIARGSLLELETQVMLCQRLNYLENTSSLDLIGDIDQLSRMISVMITRLK